MRAMLLNLIGAQRSWGGPAVGDNRPTEEAPTESAVIGMLGAMIGLHRNSDVAPAFYAGYAVWSASGACITGSDKRGRRRGGMENDFHSVSGSLNAKGEVLESAIIGQRAYLADWVDVVAVVAKPTAPVALDVLVSRADLPAFPLYLGRKAFPLGGSLDASVVEGSPDAVANMLWSRFKDKGGDPATGRLWIPSGEIDTLPGFTSIRRTRTDHRLHYGFATRLLDVWRQNKAPAQEECLQEADGWYFENVFGAE